MIPPVYRCIVETEYLQLYTSVLLLGYTNSTLLYCQLQTANHQASESVVSESNSLLQCPLDLEASLDPTNVIVVKIYRFGQLNKMNGISIYDDRNFSVKELKF